MEKLKNGYGEWVVADLSASMKHIKRRISDFSEIAKKLGRYCPGCGSQKIVLNRERRRKHKVWRDQEQIVCHECQICISPPHSVPSNEDERAKKNIGALFSNTIDEDEYENRFLLGEPAQAIIDRAIKAGMCPPGTTINNLHEELEKTQKRLGIKK